MDFSNSNFLRIVGAMLKFTDTAKERISHFLNAQRAQGVSALRIAGNSSEHKLWLVKELDKTAGDQVFDGGGFDVYMDPMSATSLDGATVDFVQGVMQSGFRVYFSSPSWDDPLAQKVQDVLDKQVNPGVASHGGRVSLEGVKGDTAYITLGGGCQGCGAASMTLAHGIEVMIKEAVPEINKIVDVTDHASGANPFYAPSAVSNAQSPFKK